jgi:hydrogenase expression/formation protein HypD
MTLVKMIDRDSIFDSFHDPAVAEGYVKRLQEMKLPRTLALMHVCGTHEHSIAKAGIRSLLPEGMRLIAGPGCPVCVCPAADIDLAVQAARRDDTIVATFGDMFRVPSGDTSLELMKADGHDVRVVYSPIDAVAAARENPDREIVFVAVGFETTAGPIAAAINAGVPGNFSIIPSLRLVPPALEFLLENGKDSLDGFILPGHVSTVLGRKGYAVLEDKYGAPSVISGFEPVDLLRGIVELAEMVLAGPPFEVRNLYKRVVSEEGNPKAKELIDKVFEPAPSDWRGIGSIPISGLALREEYSGLDASSKFGLVPSPDARDVMPGCICHEVILGESEPEQCPLFGTGCTPRKPHGPCMVSSEGTCRARYQYRPAGDTY